MSDSVSSASSASAACCVSIFAKHILQPGPAVLADIAKRQVAHIHTMNDQRPGHAEDAGRLVRRQFLILPENGDTLTAEQVIEQSFDERGRPRRQGHGALLAGSVPDANLDVIALGQFGRRLGPLPVPIRKFNEPEHLSGHGVSFVTKISDGRPNCNI
ncbi:hypothetical protein SAMN05519104_5429 [Rhizobiales bacterium GAS188]|nr:hypothetical protein SAMN05519104_5429 [Rhizobiales bacterium GAS188]